MSKTADYNVTLEKEVLREVAANIHAEYFHYMDKNGVNHSDMTNPVVLLANDAFRLKDFIVRDCRNFDDLKLVEGKLQELKSVIERLA